MDRRTFLRRAALVAMATTPVIGCTNGSPSRKRLAGTTGWYRNWSPNVVVGVDDDNVTAQSKIDANAGGIVGFASGTHVERSVTPKGPGQRFIGRADGSTRFDGSRDIGTTNWSGTGAGPWTKGVPGGLVDRDEVMDTEYTVETRSGLQPFWGTEAAQLPEDLWVKTGSEEQDPYYVGADGWKRLTRVLPGDRVGPGEWKLEYDPVNLVTIGDEPSQYDEIRLSVTRYAVQGRRHRRLLLADLWIDKYATWIRDSPLGEQPIHKRVWEYHYVTVSGAHSSGFTVSPGTIMRNCLSRHNGRYGVNGNDFGWEAKTDGVRWDVQDSRFTRNLLVDYNAAHGGGGCKFGVESTDPEPSLLVNCWFDYNNHHGVWFDHAFEDPGIAKAEMRSCLIEHNAGRGFHYEIFNPRKVVAKWNRIYRNGVGDMPGNLMGTSAMREGLRVTSSTNLQFIQNVLEENHRGILIVDVYPKRQVPLANIIITGNEVHTMAGGQQGRLQRWQYDETAGNNNGRRLATCGADRNRYHIATIAKDDFEYERGGHVVDFAGWQAIRSGDEWPGTLDPQGSIDTGSVSTPTGFVPFRQKHYGTGSGLDA